MDQTVLVFAHLFFREEVLCSPIIMLSLVSKIPIRPNVYMLSPPKTHKLSVEICLRKTMGTIKDYATCGTKLHERFDRSIIFFPPNIEI